MVERTTRVEPYASDDTRPLDGVPRDADAVARSGAASVAALTAAFEVKYLAINAFSKASGRESSAIRQALWHK